MPCRFHKGTLQLLSRQYERDTAAVRGLEERAFALGVALPASFLEWYGMRDGVALLSGGGGADDPVEIERLGVPIEWRWPKKRDLVKEGLLLFMVENQAVCIWALQLDAGDDPPVLVARDPELEWRPYAPCFSTFIECQMWDQSVIGAAAAPGGSRILLQAQDAVLRPGDLRSLRQIFEEKPTTHGWPGENQYRFECDTGGLLIWDSEDQADWFIAARSESALMKVATDVWNCGGLRESLWSNDERGEKLLKEIRSKDA